MNLVCFIFKVFFDLTSSKLGIPAHSDFINEVLVIIIALVIFVTDYVQTGIIEAVNLLVPSDNIVELVTKT